MICNSIAIDLFYVLDFYFDKLVRTLQNAQTLIVVFELKVRKILFKFGCVGEGRSLIIENIIYLQFLLEPSNEGKIFK